LDVYLEISKNRFEFSLDVCAMKVLRLIGAAVFAIVGIALLVGPLSAIPDLSQLSSYQLGGLTGSVFIALLAFALAWQCARRRS
jgi:hypothetical protein